jgi:hypothetical protein
MHLIKLSVGPESLTQLATWQQQRLNEQARRRQTPELIHITRHKPKREEEVLDGGSIYWVIKGFIVARQQLLELRAVEYNGITHCGLVYEPQMIAVRARPRKAFQGWRYFDPKDAPPDIGPWTGAEDVPDVMQRELLAMGLL